MFSLRPHKLLISVVIIFLSSVLLTSCGQSAGRTPTPEPTLEPRMPAATPVKTDESWLVLSNLPEDATQIEKGAEIWRLVCQDCHGDEGQGLTPDWIAKWAPSDQNCWQTKCHATNHPPEGFVLPRYVPPLVGATALARFETASDLQAYMRDKMPWHKPGSLQDGEYWELTAFLLSKNGISPLPPELDAQQGTEIQLHQGQ